jgi:hypothetical protein
LAVEGYQGSAADVSVPGPVAVEQALTISLLLQVRRESSTEPGTGRKVDKFLQTNNRLYIC